MSSGAVFVLLIGAASAAWGQFDAEAVKSWREAAERGEASVWDHVLARAGTGPHRRRNPVAAPVWASSRPASRSRLLV